MRKFLIVTLLFAIAPLFFVGCINLPWGEDEYFTTRVYGPSMQPTINSGDEIRVRRTQNVATNDIIVIERTDNQGAFTMVVRAIFVGEGTFRLEAYDKDITLTARQVWVMGDNRTPGPDIAWDSMMFGSIYKSDVVGVVVSINGVSI